MCTDDNRSPRRGHRVATLAGLFAVPAYWLPALSALVPALRAPFGVEDRTTSGEGYALTFDDGPDEHGTQPVLEALARTDARATFFLVGEQVRRNPSLVSEIVAAGHTVGFTASAIATCCGCRRGQCAKT